MRVNVQFKPKGIVHYMQLDGDERLETTGAHVRKSGALEPFLTVLPSTRQVIRYRVLDLDYLIGDDNGLVCSVSLSKLEGGHITWGFNRH